MNSSGSMELNEDARGPWKDIGEAVSMLQLPVISDREFLLTDFLAKDADNKGIGNTTEAFKAAITACNKAGGGRVVVPQGNYYTGPIYLQSGVNLHLQKGACVYFSTDPKDYLPLVLTRWEGVELMNYSPFIYAYGEKNISLTGEGILDGQASELNWWTWRGDKQWGWQEGMPHQNSLDSRNKLFQMAEESMPVAARKFGEGHFLRPSFVQFYHCENILMEGFSLQNAPMWALHPVLCKNVMIRGVSIDSRGPNVDGCNPESCSRVLIEHCRFSVSHDCIAIKSGRNRGGRRIGVPTEWVLVRHCTFGSGHGAIVIGSETSGGINNIFVEDCTLTGPGLCRALRIKTSSARGGLIDGIYLRNIYVKQVSEEAVLISMLYEDAGLFFPVIKNIEIQDMQVEQCGKEGLRLEGCPESPIHGIHLTRLNIQQAAKPYNFQHVQNISFEELTINGENPFDIKSVAAAAAEQEE